MSLSPVEKRQYADVVGPCSHNHEDTCTEYWRRVAAGSLETVDSLRSENARLQERGKFLWRTLGEWLLLQRIFGGSASEEHIVALERHLTEAKEKLEAVKPLLRRRRKPRRLLEDVRELIDRLVENADELSGFARRTRRALDRILSKEGE